MLAIVDLEAPSEPVLARAAAAAAVLEAPLRVVVLHPRSGFTTDFALAARLAHRLDVEYRRVVGVATDAARNRGLDDVEVGQAPYARSPFGGPVGRARRAAAIQRRRTVARLVVAADHLRGTGQVGGGCDR